ncbi:MAG: anti-sigma factor domain-containing protein [Actinomycetota bacterium]
MTLDHSVIEELMAVDALGGLDGEDRELLARERAEHGDCARCRAIEEGFAETAGRLGFALSPLPVSDGMADNIVGRHADGIASQPRDELAARRERPSRGWQALIAAAAVVALLIVAVATLRPSTSGITQAAPSQRIVTFTGDVEGTLAMAYTPGRPGAVFWGRDLPDPGPGMVYEIWMIEGDEAIPGGCVAPTDGVIAVRVDANIGTTDTMAVTTEPSDCPVAPTSPPVLLADLTTVV